jgi:hypothetical protein
MVRYKGQVTAKQIERENPYFVEIPIPERGLGRRLDAMHAWHSARGIPPKMGSGGLWTARFCFGEAETAQTFVANFGGTFRVSSH